MGQRLNLEIRKKNKVLANAYYHWSGYTESSAELANICINALLDNEDSCYKLKAVRALEATGAGMNPEELEYMKNYSKYSDLDFKPCKDRNAGIIAVSPKGIKDTQLWMEGYVTIDITNLDDIRINSDVWGFYESEDDYIDCCSLEAEDEIKEFKDSIFEVSYDPCNLSVSQYNDIIDILKDDNIVKFPDGTLISNFC